MAKILLVEDNETLGYVLKEYLEWKGFELSWVKDGARGLAHFERYPADLCLLDIMMPEKDGFRLAAEIREQAPKVPLIFLTARALKVDVLRGFGLGADDYITKPFDFAELLARCRAVLRRHAGAADSRQHFKGFTFDALAATLTIGDETRELRARELRLLEILLSRPGQTYSKSHLIDRLFSFDEEVSDNAIEVYVGRLRRKLDGSGARLETLRGVGYRLIPE